VGIGINIFLVIYLSGQSLYSHSDGYSQPDRFIYNVANERCMKKGQVAAEYIVIVGFALLATIPLLLLYASQSADIENKVGSGQALQVARLIVDSSESVYYLGPPSKTTLKVYIPREVQDIQFHNTQVILKYRQKGQSSISDITQEGKVNMTGTIDERRGLRKLTIQATDAGVTIS
jgi:hypothetical protein